MTFQEFLKGFIVNQRLHNETNFVVIGVVVSGKYQLHKRGTGGQTVTVPLHPRGLVTEIQRSGLLRLHSTPKSLLPQVFPEVP